MFYDISSHSRPINGARVGGPLHAHKLGAWLSLVTVTVSLDINPPMSEGRRVPVSIVPGVRTPPLAGTEGSTSSARRNNTAARMP